MMRRIRRSVRGLPGLCALVGLSLVCSPATAGVPQLQGGDLTDLEHSECFAVSLKADKLACVEVTVDPMVNVVSLFFWSLTKNKRAGKKRKVIYPDRDGGPSMDEGAIKKFNNKLRKGKYRPLRLRWSTAGHADREFNRRSKLGSDADIGQRGRTVTVERRGAKLLTIRPAPSKKYNRVLVKAYDVGKRVAVLVHHWKEPHTGANAVKVVSLGLANTATRYPAAIRKTFVKKCARDRNPAKLCRCMLAAIEQRYTFAQFKAIGTSAKKKGTVSVKFRRFLESAARTCAR